MTELPTTGRALELKEYNPDTIRVIDRPISVLKPGQILIKMAYASINPSDLAFVRGMYGIKKKLPCVPGFEGSGVVVAGTDSKTKKMVGKNVAVVAPVVGDGAWSEYMATSLTNVMILKNTISLEQGATLFVNPMTAWALMDIALKEKHKAIVQTAAASALGKMMIRLGQRFKIPVINIVRRVEQVDILSGLGAEYILNSSELGFEREFRKLSKKLEPTICFDAVSGPISKTTLELMPYKSKLVMYGALSDEAVALSPGALIFQNKQVNGFWLTIWMSEQKPKDLEKIQSKLQDLLGSDLKTDIQKTFSLDAGAEVLDYYAKNMSGGKVLFKMI